MKRSAPLRRSKPLRRMKRLRARSATKAYRRRERDVEFMQWARRQPCIVRLLEPGTFIAADRNADRKITVCTGHVEADHAGDRGLGQKADDATCVPLCRNHHRERTDHMGAFRSLNRDELRAWRAAAIVHTQAEWNRR